jgi:hypothetical protein
MLKNQAKLSDVTTFYQYCVKIPYMITQLENSDFSHNIKTLALVKSRWIEPLKVFFASYFSLVTTTCKNL